jgi:TonB family protein
MYRLSWALVLGTALIAQSASAKKSKAKQQEFSDSEMPVQGNTMTVPTPKDGGLKQEDVDKVVKAHEGDVFGCYQDVVAKTPDAHGTVRVHFQIVDTGAVGEVKVTDTKVQDDKMDQCITEAVKKWSFPKLKGGGTLEVEYPFGLRPDRVKTTASAK